MKQDMPAARRTQILELFEELSDLPPGKRTSLLDTIRLTDEELGREVETLLRRLEKADEQFDRVAGHLVRENQLLGQAEKQGTRIGNYTLVEQIGEGGFGMVWLAEQERPVRRQVALKIIKVGMDTREVVARFEAERQALALMEHPGIATVFDAGATATGRPYFVMELVRGTPITRYCDEQGLSTSKRLGLFIEVCHAVQHAHQKGIIHRDIKPSNILITLHDNKPVQKIIDFGIAKATSQQLTDKTLYTRLHTFMGTPVYASPEQIERAGEDIDTRSDIYSLGVVLYELVTGRLPFDPEKLAASGFEVISKTLREVDPPKPSAQVKLLTREDAFTVARQRATDPRRLPQLLHGDLDWIVMHCLEKDRTRRYATANELAGDIERHLSHQPIIARPPRTAYRVHKFVRRNKAAVASAAFVATALLLGIAGSTWQAVRATRAEQGTAIALESEALARRRSEALHFDSLAKRFILGEPEEGNTQGLALAIAALERVDSPERRRLALSTIWKSPLCFLLKPMGGHTPGDGVQYTRDGNWLLTCSKGSEILLWPADGGTPTPLPGDPAFKSFTLKFSPSEQLLLATYKLKGSSLFTGPWKQVLWDMQKLQPVKEWMVEKWGPQWFSDDESSLFAYSLERQSPYAGVARWILEDGRIVPLGSPHPDPPPVLRFPNIADLNQHFSPSEDLEWLVSWKDQDVYVSKIGEQSLEEPVWIGRHDGTVMSASISPHGELIGSGGHTHLTLWSRHEPGRILAKLPSQWASGLFDLKNCRLYTASDPNALIVFYDLRGPLGARRIPLLSAEQAPGQLAISPDGDWTALTGWLEYGTRENYIYNMRAVWPFLVKTGFADTPVENCIRFSIDHKQVAYIKAGQVFVMNLGSAEFPKRMIYASPGQLVVYTLEFSPDGKTLLVGTHRDGAWMVPLDGEAPRKLPDAPSFTSAAAFSPDGERIAVGGGFADILPEERYARVLDREGRLVARMGDGGNEVVQALKFIGDNNLVVSTDGGLRLWNFKTGMVHLLKGGPHGFLAASAHYILATDADGVWLYDYPSLADRKLAMETIWSPGSPRHVEALAIAPDERFVVTQQGGGTLCVQYMDEDRFHLLPGNDPGLADIWISDEGFWIGSIHGNGTLSYWPVPRGEPLHDRPLDEFLAILRRQTNIRVALDLQSPDGFRYEIEPFPGWQHNPTWQEWYSTDYMDNIAWQPTIDLQALGINPAEY